MDDAALAGRTLSHFRVVERIGAGGMGVVYRARDEHLQRDVAVKVLPSGTFGDDAARKRFRREALALAKLRHPNIATIFDFDTQDDTDFLVMEFVPGITLSDRLAAGPLPEPEVARLGVQLAEGLAAAQHPKNRLRLPRRQAGGLLLPSRWRAAPMGRRHAPGT